MKFTTCGINVELGSCVTEGCGECVKLYLFLRRDAKDRDINLPDLVPGVAKLERVLDRGYIKES
jgi:hypothetical protein